MIYGGRRSETFMMELMVTEAKESRTHVEPSELSVDGQKPPEYPS